MSSHSESVNVEDLPTVCCTAGDGSCQRRAPAHQLRARPLVWAQFPPDLQHRMASACSRCMMSTLHDWARGAGRRICLQKSCLRLLDADYPRSSCAPCLEKQRLRQRWPACDLATDRAAPPIKCAHCSARLTEQERKRTLYGGTRWVRKCERCLKTSRKPRKKTVKPAQVEVEPVPVPEPLES